MSYITRSFLALFLICYSSHVLADSPGASGPGVNVAMDEIVVSAQRLVDSISSGVYSRQTIDRDDLDGPSLGLDDVLRRVPGFGLFRRQASRAAHPTTQGVSLRGLGPNGAGRTLVLLDGMPLNDPFGGWVEWVNLPPSYIEQASVVRGGGAGTWGNSALAGVVRLDSRQLIGNSLSGDVRVGSKSSLSGSVQAQGSIADGLVTALAHHAQTDGYYLLSSEQRGEADRRAARNSEGARLSWRTETENGTVWSIGGSASSDTFINGSDDAGSKTDTYGVFLSALNDSIDGGLSLATNFYATWKDFESVFASFDAARETSRPVLDQFDVPAAGIGGNLLLRWLESPDWSIEGGADVRFSDGETNELFRNLGAGFTRERRAGGQQVVAGAFVEANRILSQGTILTVGARTDYWRQNNGSRIETDTTSGDVLINRRFAAREGVSVNGRAGFKVPVTTSTSIGGAVYSGFRVPTLNEQYRPFRVGNDITEANENLVNEKLLGAETSIEWSSRTASLSATLFRNDLHDPILNTTITTIPGFNSEFDVFIPDGGSLRQRQNIDRVETWGVEFDGILQVSEVLSFKAGYLYSDPKVRSSATSPALEGNRLAQVAKHQAILGVQVRPTDRLRLSADMIYAGKQFEDDLNSRELDDALTVDVFAGYQVTDEVEFYLAAENLFDHRVEAGRTADGLVTLGSPVFLWMGVRLQY